MKAIRQDTQRWRAVLDRDRRYDGRFVYAVKTTGIYCKPSCGARRPHKENALFFDSIEAAERAGYRECAKCRLRSVPDDLRAVHAALDFLDSHLDERVTLATLSRHVALSPFHFQRLFKRRVGVSPRVYLATRRAERLKTQLRSARNVTDASFGAGYTDERTAYSDAPRALGMTPGQYRRRGAGKLIAYLVAQTPIGKALIAATTRGIAAIYFGANAQQLEADLRDEYPDATFARYSARLSADLKAQLASGRATVLQQLRGGESLDLGLDINGTAFQSRVWEALRHIPSGQTRTYRDVAKLIGSPGAARAVARACAANKVALVIPCHRVMRSDGELANYRWGARRKRALLALEKVAS
jgi:AraC family transcriptional regulator of adaptative response/methylated-DNA-[protein]-cysteine methyltransferase